MQVHDFELNNINEIDNAISNRKNYMFSGESNFDEKTVDSLEGFMNKIRKTFYEKKFTKKRVAELQVGGYIEVPVYSDEEVQRILGSDYSINVDDFNEEAPPWFSTRKEISDNKPQEVSAPIDYEQDILVHEDDDEDVVLEDDEMPWWSDGQ